MVDIKDKYGVLRELLYQVIEEILNHSSEVTREVILDDECFTLKNIKISQFTLISSEVMELTKEIDPDFKEKLFNKIENG